MFGQNFRENWCTNLKTKQKYQEVLRKETKSTPTAFNRNRPPTSFRKLGKINSRCEYFFHCAGFQNSFLSNPISVWSSPISKGEPKGKVTNKFRNKGNVEERAKSELGEFLSTLFLVNKKDRGHRPVINLKFRNSFIPYQHLKMKRLHLIKDLLQEHDFLMKIDLKDAYFGIPLDKSSRKYIRFQWEGNLYEFLCLCFGLGPAPLIFTKLLKIAIALLTRIKKYIFRRHASDGPNVEINFASKGDIDFSVTKFRFCDKF